MLSGLPIGFRERWLAGQIMKFKGLGLFGNLVVGCVGAFNGGFLFSELGIYTHGLIGALIGALAGALLLLWVIGLLRKKK